MVRREAAGNDRSGKGTSGVDGSVGVAGSKQVAGEDGETVWKRRHEGRTVLLMDDHVIDKAKDRGQEELEEETASDALAVVLLYMERKKMSCQNVIS